ncbi:MAG TPA: hypothetical protein VKO84_08555 [Gaiellaceae bacterium]|nr:hypothetical protein [Gaiellaceae bacterium]
MVGGRRAGIAAVCALVALAAVVAGCGGEGQALALDPVAAAATKTQDAGTARIRYTLSFTAPQLQGGTVRINGSGVIDGTSGIVNLDLGSAPRGSGLPAGSSITEIYLEQGDDFVVYMQLGALASQMPGGKQWLKLDLTKLGKSAGVDLNKLMSGSQLQPTDLLSMLKSEGATVRTVGREKVGGAATTHYHVTVNMAKALEAEGVSNPTLAGIASEAPSIPEDVWVGSDGLVRRIELSYGLKSTRMAMSMDLYDYGVNLAIAAPPSNEVYDATQLAQRGMSSIGSSSSQYH